MNLRKKLIGFSVGVSTLLVVTPALVLAAIPDTSGVIHSCYNNGILPSFKIYDPGIGQSCGLGQTALTWVQDQSSYMKQGESDTIVTNSGGIVTDGHTTPLTAECDANELASNPVLVASGSGALGVIGYTGPSREGDAVTLTEYANSTGSGIYIDSDAGVANANVTITFYVLCTPVQSLPS